MMTPEGARRGMPFTPAQDRLLPPVRMAPMKHPLKMLLVQDQQPVETLRANGAHEPLRHPVRLRGAKRRLPPPERAGRSTSSRDGRFVAGGCRVRAEARRFPDPENERYGNF
jgi:hypothetical protein